MEHIKQGEPAPPIGPGAGNPKPPVQCAHAAVSDWAIQQMAAWLETPNDASRLSMVEELGDREVAKAVAVKRGLKSI